MRGWHTDITVAALAERDGRFLVVEEHVGGRLVYNQPAGHLEDGETLAQAVVRETQEETGWTVVPDAVTGIYLMRSARRPISILRVCFCVRLVEQDPHAQLDEGIVQACWRSRDELVQSQRLRSPLVLRGIDDYLEDRRYPLELLTSVNLSQP